MINAKYIGINELVLFCTVASEKDEPRKTTLNGIINRVSGSYVNYLTGFPALQSKESSDFTAVDEEADALIHCYTSDTASMNHVKGLIFSQQPDELKSLCPYCLLDRPGTLDHYISKADFPEYAILIKNLIPCCHKCNNAKKKWRTRMKRRFIHFYIDNFISQRFLFARLTFVGGAQFPTIRYYLKRPAGMISSNFLIIKHHFQSLELVADYSRRANTIVSSEAEIMGKSIRAGQTHPHVRQELLNRMESESNRLGVNNWISVAYDAMANSKRFIRSLK